MYQLVVRLVRHPALRVNDSCRCVTLLGQTSPFDLEHNNRKWIKSYVTASEHQRQLASFDSHRGSHHGAPAAGQAVVEVDLPGLGDGPGLVEVHQLVEGAEPLGPQVVLAAGLPHHLEVLDVALVPGGGDGKHGGSEHISQSEPAGNKVFSGDLLALLEMLYKRLKVHDLKMYVRKF